MTLDYTACVNYAASQVLRKYKRYVELDDLIQVGLLWVTEHPTYIESLEEVSEKLAQWRLQQRVTSPMVSYARAEKRQRLGYEATDEAFYSLNQLAEILPAVFENDPEPPRSASNEIRSPGDPAEGGNWLASWLDVKHAWGMAELTGRERSTLLALYGEGESQASLADLLGVTAQAVQQTNTRALRKLQRVLGGERDRGCPYGCECHSYRERP